MTYEWLLVAGVLLGSLSPLLTFARLFQMKEWRLDRLGEHLRREGWFGNLMGRARGALALLYVALGAAAYALAFAGGDGTGAEAVIAVFLFSAFWCLVTFSVLTVAQIVLRKQRMPAWTSKALALVATALVVDAALAYASLYTPWMFALPLLVVLQPAALLAAWLLWKPVDFVLKGRVLGKGCARRDSLVDATVIGIVGSVGKTTTKELLKCVLADRSPFVTPEHVNTEMGVAQWLVNAVPANAVKPLLIVEMGAYRKGEIALLGRIAQPTIAVVTALGSDHVALFGSEEAIVDANAEIFDALPEGANVFLYGDNERTTALANRTHRPTFTVGAKDLQDLRETDRGLAFDCFGTRFNVALHGRHNAANVALALLVANSLGITPERMRELLAAFRPTQHTFHLKKERGVTILDDTYNVSPLSFRAALDWAKARPERPRVLLTSGLLETGAAENDFLRELGAAANASVERVVFTTDAGKEVFAKAFGKPVDSLADAKPVTDDALLLCVGRMPLSHIQKLLPADR